MNERKLLELAGAAIGLSIEWHQEMSGAFPCYKIEGGYIVWNPLINDGDALRLAEKLKFTLDLERGTIWGPGELDETVLARVSREQPSMCRAIVLAAAEMAKNGDS